MLPVYLMFRRFRRAFKIAAAEEGFLQIFGAGVLLVAVGTVTYTTTQDWSLVDGFYFAVATLTTSSIADPDLTLESGWIKVFTVLYVLVGIGLLVEMARQIGFAFVEVVEDGERAVRALRRFGTPLVDLLAPSPYATFQSGMDDTVLHGWHYYWKATNLAGLTDDAIAIIADHAYAARSPRSYAAMFHMGGAVARLPHDATAYAARDMTHNIIIDAVWRPEESGEHAAAETAWARRFLQALQPHRAGGVYVNFLDSDDDAGRVREAYGDQTYRRLTEVKATYDPDNTFHHNKNIRRG
jgi:hypothetical protein